MTLNEAISIVGNIQATSRNDEELLEFWKKLPMDHPWVKAFQFYKGIMSPMQEPHILLFLKRKQDESTLGAVKATLASNGFILVEECENLSEALINVISSCNEEFHIKVIRREIRPSGVFFLVQRLGFVKKEE